MAELVDAHSCELCDRKVVRVRVPVRARASFLAKSRCSRTFNASSQLCAYGVASSGRGPFFLDQTPVQCGSARLVQTTSVHEPPPNSIGAPRRYHSISPISLGFK